MLKTHVVAISDEVVPLVNINARRFIGNNLLIAKKTHYRHKQTAFQYLLKTVQSMKQLATGY